MKALFALTAAAIAASAFSLPASAGTIGCDVGNPNASVNATSCDVQPHAMIQAPVKAQSAFAAVPQAHAAVRSTLYNPTADDQGING